MQWTARGVLALTLTGIISACGPALRPPPTPTPTNSTDPVVSDNYVAITSDKHAAQIGGRRFTDNSLGLLIGPHFLIRQQSIGTVSDISAGTARAIGLDGPVRAAPGHEFVVADFTPYVGYHQPVPAKGRQPGSLRGAKLDPGHSQSVVVGKSTRPLRTLPAGGTLLIVAAPVKARVQLKVVDSGRTQLLDLRTGRRARDAVSGFYPNQDWTPPYPLDDNAWLGKGVAGRRPIATKVMKVQAQLTPFAPDAHWSRPGRAWLYVTVQVASVCPRASCRVTLAPGKQVRLRVRGHDVHDALGRPFRSIPVYDYLTTNGLGTFAFEVPDDLRSATLVVSTAGPVSVQLPKPAKAKRAPAPKRAGWSVRPSPVVVGLRPA